VAAASSRGRWRHQDNDRIKSYFGSRLLVLPRHNGAYGCSGFSPISESKSNPKSFEVVLDGIRLRMAALAGESKESVGDPGTPIGRRGRPFPVFNRIPSSLRAASHVC